MGDDRGFDNLDPIMSIPLGRPNDKTQYPIPSRQSPIHGTHETSKRSQTNTRPIANGSRHPKPPGFDEGARRLAIPGVHTPPGPDAVLLIDVLRFEELCKHSLAAIERGRVLLGDGFDDARSFLDLAHYVHGIDQFGPHRELLGVPYYTVMTLC